jgi:hypothetical protein
VTFCASVLAFDGDWGELRGLAMKQGPEPLRIAAQQLSQTDLGAAVERYLCGEGYESPASFFARVLLRRDLPCPSSHEPNRCPACGQPPQCGSLHPEGHGSAFFLVCSLCAREWSFPRGQCPVCGERAVFYSSGRMPHVETQVCEGCRRYFHVIDCGKDPSAVPLLDEVAALAMDVWAREQGYRKIHPNLAGI